MFGCFQKRALALSMRAVHITVVNYFRLYLGNLFACFRTLEIILPLMEHPSEEFLASIEEDMISMIMRYSQMIVQVLRYSQVLYSVQCTSNITKPLLRN